MKKRFSIIVVLLALITMAACSSKGSNTTVGEQGSGNDKEQTEVTATTEPTATPVPTSTPTPTPTPSPTPDPMAFESPVPIAKQNADYDSILQEAWQLYKAEDYAGLIALDGEDKVASAVEQITTENPDTDRYITYLPDDNTYAMMYLGPDNGYWWYFGDIADGAREGNGACFIVFGDEKYHLYVGEYKNDTPCGTGRLTMVDSNGVQAMNGSFDGNELNGTYDCEAYYINDDGSRDCDTAESVEFTNGLPKNPYNSKIEKNYDYKFNDGDYAYLMYDDGEYITFWSLTSTGDGFDVLSGNPAFTK